MDAAERRATLIADTIAAYEGPLRHHTSKREPEPVPTRRHELTDAEVLQLVGKADSLAVELAACRDAAVQIISDERKRHRNKEEEQEARIAGLELSNDALKAENAKLQRGLGRDHHGEIARGPGEVFDWSRGRRA